MLAALQHEDELAMHTKAALRNGLTEDEIREVLLQVGLYAGVPVANRAFAIAEPRDQRVPRRAGVRPLEARPAAPLVVGAPVARQSVRHANICTLGGIGGRSGYIVGLTG